MQSESIFLDVLLQVMRLVMADTLFLVVCLLLLVPLSKFKTATFAVMKRNLFGYFNNPTGYVFICLFVLVGSAFAFWPHEFFNSNLATLGELNKTFPLIMLLFIPTITMSIWADERRNGTDELLLTIPATDLDIVVGKYLAVAAIFTSSLLFSQVANFTVLNILALGDIDTGLFATTYLGYWMIGLAMLSLGMAASFLTKNLTVGFVLGVIFNAPLVLTANADLIVRSSGLAKSISHWSHAAQFDDFGRGVISFRPVVFFLMVVVLGLYFCVVLIGRRHWYGGQNTESKLGHYIVRGLSLVTIAIGLNIIFSTFNLFRHDMTSEKVSSISQDTNELLATLDPDRTVQIEAFISKTVPEQYARTKLDLITMLNEFAARGGDALNVKIYDNLDPFSEGAVRADEQYNIQPVSVTTQDRGTLKQERIFLAAAFQRADESVVVPFFDQGLPVEYELIRSINTVADVERPRIGVVSTLAELFGRFVNNNGRTEYVSGELIIQELEKQYTVVPVDPSSEIEAFDVLLVVQPSSMTPAELDNLIDAVKSGQPTAIFEDPLPRYISAPATAVTFPESRPKCDIQRLWDVLGISITSDSEEGVPSSVQDPPSIIYQRYNPYPIVQEFGLTPEFVFASPAAPGAKFEEAINVNNPITSGLDQLLFAYTGAINHNASAGMGFEPLVMTGTSTGTVSWGKVQAAEQTLANNPNAERYLVYERLRDEKMDRYCLAAKITGAPKESAMSSILGPSSSDRDAKRGSEVNVVYVADSDLMANRFLIERSKPDGLADWQFDNVPFVLNILDHLANDERLIEIRKRQPRHSTLKMINRATESARDRFAERKAEFDKTFRAEEARVNSLIQAKIADIRGKMETAQQNNDIAEQQRLMANFRQEALVLGRKNRATMEKLNRARDSEQKQIELELNQNIMRVQNFYKQLAVCLPPIPPMLVGLIVFWKRRKRELVGVIDERLR